MPSATLSWINISGLKYSVTIKVIKDTNGYSQSQLYFALINNICQTITHKLWVTNRSSKVQYPMYKNPSTHRAHIGMREKAKWLWTNFLWEDVTSGIFAAFLHH